MPDLLLVEDDDDIGEQLRDAISVGGHAVTWVRTGGAALVESRARGYDLVLLDLGLPDLDGLEVCRRIKAAQSGAVVVVLTARAAELDVVSGLDAGADDYLVKPVRISELLARIRAHLRRTEPRADAPLAWSAGDLTLDPRARRCSVRGREIALRGKEFDLLERLLADQGTAVSRETLMSEVWDEHWFGSTKTLDVHVAALRRRLSDVSAAQPEASLPEITTLRGHGYRLDVRRE